MNNRKTVSNFAGSTAEKRSGVGIYGRTRRIQKREGHRQFCAGRQAALERVAIKPKEM